MHDNLPQRPRDQNIIDLARPLSSCAQLLESLFIQSQGASWGLSLERFQCALEISIRKRFASAPPSPATLEQYLTTLHVQDLALACACADGIEPAWEYFVAAYRHYLYSAAAAIIRRPSDDPYVREFADSVYATLYGKDTAEGRNSLFEHFHGRSKLATWLRAVLAQRYVDVIRREKKFDSLDEGLLAEPKKIPAAQQAAGPADPHRSQYLRCLADALQQAIVSLDASDRARLYSYYFEECTLSDIARQFHEHEATASRKLERIRRELRDRVTEILRQGKPSQNHPAGDRGTSRGMDDTQVRLCFEYAIEDWPFDLDGLLGSMNVSRMPDRKPRERIE
jgi:RNA polymerase sigma factor (sigma-70 family)